MKLGHVLFYVGFGCLIVSFVIFHIIGFTIWYPAEETGEFPQVGALGPTMWTLWIIGIVLIGLGYWRKK